MPAPDTIAGQDTDVVSHYFLMAPLPTLPHLRCLFQNEEGKKSKDGSSTTLLIEHYHAVANTIEAGFGNNATISPSTWIRISSDLIA
jgi:hypothetical protein